MKVTIVGGGSTYTPEFVSGLLSRRESLGVHELCLMDIALERLDVVGGFAKRMVSAQGDPFRVTTTSDLRSAIAGADYVVTQVRVGGMEARKADEYLGMRHGLIGQETTGVGGMAKALRTIPVILEVARTMHELAPDALLLNFANPAGLVVEALNRAVPGIQFVGVCNGPFSIQQNLLDIAARRRGLNVAGQSVVMHTLGLNHLSFSNAMLVDGQDIWSLIMSAYLEELHDGKNTHIPFDADTISALNMVPSSYLQYFYYTQRKLAQQQNWPPSRAEQVMEIEAVTLSQFHDVNLHTPPPELMQRGGAYYSTVATDLIASHAGNLGEIHTMNVRHNGAVAGWSPDWVLEMPCRVDASGITPLELPALPPVCTGLITQVKMYELLVVEAALNGDRNAAYSALLAHPLRPEADQIKTVLNDLFATHSAYLPQFAHAARALS